MGAPKLISRCFNCGERLFDRTWKLLVDGRRVSFGSDNFKYRGDKKYRLTCHKCKRYIELITDSWDEAEKLFSQMFSGTILYPIGELHEDDCYVLGWNVPVCEPPEVIHISDVDFDPDRYTHFSHQPDMRMIESEGKITPYPETDL